MDCLELDETKTQSLTLHFCVNDFSNILTNAIVTTHLCQALPIQKGMQEILNVLIRCCNVKGGVYIAGNGGSAAIASHAVIDFLNMCSMRATAMLDPAVTTCISNDYGYDQIYSKQLMRFIQRDDVLIAISSSGKSQNIINAVEISKKQGAKIITFSGFSELNPLRTTGDYNLWLNSTEYGQVEIGHAFMLHYLTDRLKEYCVEQELV